MKWSVVYMYFRLFIWFVSASLSLVHPVMKAFGIITFIYIVFSLGSTRTHLIFCLRLPWAINIPDTYSEKKALLHLESVVTLNGCSVRVCLRILENDSNEISIFVKINITPPLSRVNIWTVIVFFYSLCRSSPILTFFLFVAPPSLSPSAIYKMLFFTL